MVGASKVGAITNSIFEDLIAPDDDRIFVLIRQNGGNDGLNMVIPIDQYSNLSRFRSNILIPENQILKLTDETGLHPRMTGMKTLFDEGVISIIQNVGYENQNRSHFRSLDIWDSGSLANEVLSTGWIGRYLDTDYPGFPDGYPNEDSPHPIAITMGPRVSETCQGSASNFSLAISDPTALANIPGTEGGALPDLPYGDELAYLRQVVAQTNEYAAILNEAAEMGTNQSTLYPEDGNNSLADQLKTVAQLISGGLQTKVYVVNINGFDTHANQVDNGDPTTGTHSLLLGWLSEAIHAFMDDLRAQGLDHRVVGATRSEFGRQIESNGSMGTDHGTAAPLILFGSCVQSGIVGPNPEIPDALERQAGVPAQVDFKNIFGSIMMDWFGASEATISSIFSHDFQYTQVIDACSMTTSSELPRAEVDYVHAYPNPFFEQLSVQFNSPGGQMRMSIFNTTGQEVFKLEEGNITTGPQTRTFALPELPPGHYVLRLAGQKVIQSNSLLHF